jgi:hypothetical protein
MIKQDIKPLGPRSRSAQFSIKSHFRTIGEPAFMHHEVKKAPAKKFLLLGDLKKYGR